MEPLDYFSRLIGNDKQTIESIKKLLCEEKIIGFFSDEANQNLDYLTLLTFMINMRADDERLIEFYPQLAQRLVEISRDDRKQALIDHAREIKQAETAIKIAIKRLKQQEKDSSLDDVTKLENLAASYIEEALEIIKLTRNEEAISNFAKNIETEIHDISVM